MDDLAAEHLALKFEQALLAERRLAMDTAIEKVLAFGGYGSQEDAEELAESLRAAAEREVGK